MSLHYLKLASSVEFFCVFLKRADAHQTPYCTICTLSHLHLWHRQLWQPGLCLQLSCHLRSWRLYVQLRDNLEWLCVYCHCWHKCQVQLSGLRLQLCSAVHQRSLRVQCRHSVGRQYVRLYKPGRQLRQPRLRLQLRRQLHQRRLRLQRWHCVGWH
jgi:hypothetical protein